MSDKELYKNKYRVQSARLQNWDYSANGAYFITICTKNRDHYFGEIETGKMNLSQVGVIADILWYEIKNHAKNVELDAFVVMPNHIHGILVLNDDDDKNVSTDTRRDRACCRDRACPVSTTTPNQTPGQNRFQNQGKNSVSSIIGSYKSAVTKHANRLGFEFAWQTRFWDHIVRDE